MDLTRPTAGLARRLLDAVHRDPADSAHPLRDDALLAAAMMAVSAALGLVADPGHRLDALGWVLLLAAPLPLVWRRRHTTLALLAVVALVGPYHALDYAHTAPIPASMIMIYTFASASRPRRTLVAGVTVLSLVVFVSLAVSADDALDSLRISGWIAAVFLFGAYVRVYRDHLASLVGRAERAERGREQEAARRVTEERLRIARDLHDLLAHSITMIGVRTSVASHVLTSDPGRLDREAVARALDEIAETCRSARAEVRTTLEVLRADGPDGRAAPADGPLPGLDALPALARTSGAALAFRADGPAPVPPAVAAAAFRIVQESLTNATRHGGPGTRARVTVEQEDGALHVTVADDGDAGAPSRSSGGGFGILGMRERARSVGGTLATGARAEGGYEVVAVLPLEPERRVVA